MSTTKKIIGILSSFAGTVILVPLVVNNLPKIISKINTAQEKINNTSDSQFSEASEDTTLSSPTEYLISVENLK